MRARTLAGAAVVLAPGHQAIALLGAASVPVLARDAEDVEAVEDPYRRALLTALVRRAIESAR
jgi:hypothetical protein